MDRSLFGHGLIFQALAACLIVLFWAIGIHAWTVLQDRRQRSRTPKVLKASDHVNDGKYHLLLAATGSVATIKIPNILSALEKYDNLSVRLVLSESAAQFLQAQAGEQPSLNEIAKFKNVDGIYRDADEWIKPWVRGDSILHIELRRWADMMVIAPLSADSLAKLALGVSDNLISSVVRAWDTHNLIDTARPGIALPYGGKKIIMVAPAMNTAMWNHPVTSKHLDVLAREWGVEQGGWFEVLWPIDKGLACGDTGSGAMREWKEIVSMIESAFGLAPESEKSTVQVAPPSIEESKNLINGSTARDRDDGLLKTALRRIERAKSRGQSRVNLTPDEASALERLKAKQDATTNDDGKT